MRREEHAHLVKAQSESNIAFYGTAAIVAIGVLGAIGYYFYQSETPQETSVHQPKETPVHHPEKISAKDLKWIRI